MLWIVRIGALLLVTALTQVCAAIDDQPNDALKRAQTLSSLTGPHAQPFHLKLSVSEPANPNSPYRATIEEFWRSSTDWQRTIDSPGFRQNLLVKGNSRNEQNSGDYYPMWLRSFVTAAIDPLEDVAFWNQISARIVLTTTTNGKPITNCARGQFKIGTPALNNDAFAVICFSSDGTLESVVRPGYDMEFHDAQAFGKKRIAFRYVDDPEPGTNLVGTIEILEQIKDGAIPALTDLAGQSADQIKSVPINQDSFDRLAAGQPTLVWPSVHSGNTSGKLSMFVSADKDGHVREAYPLNSDNTGLQDAARDQLLKWQLKPAVVNGNRVQVEAAVTFAFSTTVEGASVSSPTVTSDSSAAIPDAKPIVISPMIAHSLQTKSYPPVYPQTLKEHRVSGKVELRAVIGKSGQIVSLTPISSNNPGFTSAAITAVQHWTYKPYLLNGVPVEIETILTVNFQMGP